MRRHIKRATLQIIGWTLIALGFAGVLLPLLPGVALIIIGLYALSLTSVWFKYKKEAISLRYPTFGKLFTWLDTKFSHMNML